MMICCLCRYQRRSLSYHCGRRPIPTSLSGSQVPPSLLLFLLMLLLLLSAHAGTATASTCNYHDMTAMKTVKSVWESEFISTIDGDEHTEIRFQKGYMLAVRVFQTSYGSNYTEMHYARKCIAKMGDNKFMVRHEEPGKLATYVCIEFVKRGISIVQIRESEYRPELDLQFCQDHRLDINPWPLILRLRIEDEYVLCPLQGGYNMKITNANGMPNGCNMKALPMRLESECISGEGMVFDFRSKSCLQGTPMDISTNIICVTEWWDSGYTFTIVRSHKGQVWCLRTNNGTENRDEITSELFFDLVCARGPKDFMGWTRSSGGAGGGRKTGHAGNQRHDTISFITMNLERVTHTNLCQDEYKECSHMACPKYIENECPLSCRKCSPRMPPPVCSFPSSLRGVWYQRDYDGGRVIHIGESTFHIERVGNFKCISLNKVSTRSEGRYSVVSTFRNGCRPRYSCIQIKDISPMVMGYVLSSSYGWPLLDEELKKSICADQRFVPDVKPIRDTYRSFPDSLKPIVSRSRYSQFEDCGFRTSYEIRLALKPGVGCYGSMFQDCLDNTKFRIEMKDCPAHNPVTDFYCLSRFKTNYWESAVLLQNRDNITDEICLLFSEMKEKEVLVMAASQCSRIAGIFVRAKIMKPLLVYTIMPEVYPCKDIPVRTTTPPPATRMVHPSHKKEGAGNGDYKKNAKTHPNPIGIPGILSVYRETDERINEHKGGDGEQGSGSGAVRMTSFPLVLFFTYILGRSIMPVKLTET